MKITRWVGVLLLSALFTKMGVSQQLRLGNNPSSIIKSAVLELQSNNQGLLFSRISDTALINLMNPPDGMVIFFTPIKQLLLRANGYWQPMTSAAALNNYWSVAGNSNGSEKKIGTTDNYALPFVTNNIERMRINTSGNVGIGTSNPSTTVHIKSGIANDAGLRLENCTSSSTATSGAAVLGVDATGKVVRAKTPVYYSGGVGGTATVDDITKIWVAEVSNTASGTQTINIPANVGFSSIASIQVTAKGGSNITNMPIAIVIANTLTSLTVMIVESKTTGVLIGGTVEGVEVHINTNTKIYIRIEGN